MASEETESFEVVRGNDAGETAANKGYSGMIWVDDMLQRLQGAHFAFPFLGAAMKSTKAQVKSSHLFIDFFGVEMETEKTENGDGVAVVESEKAE